ncbi:CBU_0592 family membrane protein [Methyloglobulus sp.]|uniref:CBU_0592 family membrane protein n=1 Tax=Methyloglobulus sp. TaxID=2518622 RepID=UPI00398A1975
MLINDKHLELIGWIGFILIVSAYLFVTIKLVEASSSSYHLMNLEALCVWLQMPGTIEPRHCFGLISYGLWLPLWACCKLISLNCKSFV